MESLGSAKISGKSQICIPKDVVEYLQLERGNHIIFLKDKEGFVYISKEIRLPEKIKGK